MTKEEAKDHLDDYLSDSYERGRMLPEFDEIVLQYFGEKGVVQYSFRYLLKIAYDLEDKK
jgi:hypothetical protein